MRKRFFGVLAAGLIGLTLVGSAGTATAAAEPGATVGLGYTTVDPVRVLDTRAGMPVSARGEVSVNLAGRVPAGTTAVVLNVTAISPTAYTYVTAHDRWAPRPGVSNLNVRAHEIRSAEVTVSVDPSRPWVTLYNHNGNVNLAADLVGHYSADGDAYFNALHGPKRLFDTRAAGGGALFPGGANIAPLDDVAPGLVPADATALVLNVTAIDPTADTYLTVGGGRHVDPTTSTVNVEKGETTANKAVVAIEDRAITVRNNAGRVHVAVDVLGYYGPDGHAYYPVAPVRVYDNRAFWPLPSGGAERVPLGDVVPAEAEAVAFNLTGADDHWFGSTYLTAFQAGATRPNISQLNLYMGQTASNQTVVPLGVSRAIDLYNNTHSPYAIIDLFGYFAPRA